MAYSVIDPIKELLTPLPDGVITDFSTSQAYSPGSLSIWKNGHKVDPSVDNGFLEIGPTSVRMKAPPLLGDRIWGEYGAA